MKAKIAQAIMGTKINFPHRHMQFIDTGVEVDVPEGYSLRIALWPKLSNKGMVAVNASSRIKNGKITVGLLNCGREIVELNDGEPIATVWVEKDVPFEWEEMK